jgi:hypothetical protein
MVIILFNILRVRLERNFDIIIARAAYAIWNLGDNLAFVSGPRNPLASSKLTSSQQSDF